MYILAVCTGNLCRSPLAEALLAQALPDYKISSAGTVAFPNLLVPMPMQILAARNGLDLSTHRSRRINEFLCRESGLILVMDQGHKMRLESVYPFVRGKVFRIGHYLGFDIADPYGQTEEVYEQVFTKTAEAVNDWVARLRRIT